MSIILAKKTLDKTRLHEHFVNSFARPEPYESSPFTNLQTSFSPDSSHAFDSWEADLQQVFKRFKSFISKESFEVRSFRSESSKIRQDISRLERIASQEFSLEKLTEKIRFVADQFDIMWKFSEFLLQYSDPGAPGNRLLYKVAELNVRLLKFFEIDGQLDPKEKYNFDSVSSLMSILVFWYDRFQELSGVQHGTRRAFETQFLRAKNTLLTLRKYFSDQDRFLSWNFCPRRCLDTKESGVVPNP